MKSDRHIIQIDLLKMRHLMSGNQKRKLTFNE